MKRTSLLNHFNSAEVDACIDLNPLVVAEHVEFGRIFHGDYREEAIKQVASKRLPFESTCNSLWNLIEKLVSIKCPYCKHGMKMNNSGGNATNATTEFQCPKCKATASLTMDWAGLAFRPKGG